jgi:hypothetical protein
MMNVDMMEETICRFEHLFTLIARVVILSDYVQDECDDLKLYYF